MELMLGLIFDEQRSSWMRGEAAREVSPKVL